MPTHESECRRDPGAVDLAAGVARGEVRSAFETLPPARRRIVYETRLAHMLVMALDGYAVHNHINPRGVADEQTIDAMARLLLGEAPVKSRREDRG